MRTCIDCGLKAKTEEDLKLFSNSQESKFGKRNLCRKCAGKRTDNTKEEMKKAKAKYQAAKRYGVSLEEYETNMASSDCCEVCGKTKDLCYDHCHETGKFRGILCRGCNRSIGQLGDTAEALEKAYNYLRRAR